MERKKLLVISILLLLTFNILAALNLGPIPVSAADYPSVYVDPESTIDPGYTSGPYEVAIKTDYTGLDITAYQFTLSFNPTVLNGVSLANGDIIDFGLYFFNPGTFDNVAGTLSLTGAFFFTAGDVAPGPGTLANVTFEVVGTGVSDITIGQETQLIGWNSTAIPPVEYFIVNAGTMPDNIGHGSFNNVPPIHDVAVIALNVQSEAVVGDIVPISVTVANEGAFNESVTLTVSYDSTNISTTTFSLNTGSYESFSIDWNTTGVGEGNYTIEANATIPDVDDDLSDNTDTKPIEVKTVHDVAVTALVVQSEAVVGDVVPINVTVTNVGHFEENVTLTVSYIRGGPNPVTESEDTANFTLSSGASELTSFNWSTASLDTKYPYTVNATATIDQTDENPSDNTVTTLITLVLGHDVAVTALVVQSEAVVGDIVPISVTVANEGAFNESVITLTVSYDSTNISTTTFSLNTGSYESFSIDWNTTDVDPGSRFVKAKAVIDGDTNTDNNEDTKVVFVSLPRGSVAGIVTDASTEDPIVGANVTVNGSSDITDAVGHYNITDLPVGTYTVTVSAEGYESSSDTITVTAGGTTSFNVALTPVQPPDILPYVGGAAIAIIIVTAIAIYLLKVRKPT
jgi:hypothetical protein